MSDLKLVNLKFSDGVVRTPDTDKVIERLDVYFFKADMRDYISSIYRGQPEQLKIIQNYAIKYGIIKPGDNLNLEDKIIFEGEENFRWQVVWSQVRSKGIIVNPPVLAKVLTDVIIDGNINIKGYMREPSPHFTGKCFDLAVMSGNNINDEFKLVELAKNDGIGIEKIVLERVNDCIHVQVI